MSQKSGSVKEPAEKVVQNIRRATRKRYSAEEKIRIVLEGLRGEDSIAELCRRESISQNLYYRKPPVRDAAMQPFAAAPSSSATGEAHRAFELDARRYV